MMQHHRQRLPFEQHFPIKSHEIQRRVPHLGLQAERRDHREQRRKVIHQIGAGENRDHGMPARPTLHPSPRPDIRPHANEIKHQFAGHEPPSRRGDLRQPGDTVPLRSAARAPAPSTQRDPQCRRPDRPTGQPPRHRRSRGILPASPAPLQSDGNQRPRHGQINGQQVYAQDGDHQQLQHGKSLAKD